LQQAYVAQYIRDEKIWLGMLADRNETSHTYNEQLAYKIYVHIKESYNPVLQKTFKEIEAHFA
jgi:nucleotidyltransferase substrate binding protein (TIGR01987 family)